MNVSRMANGYIRTMYELVMTHPDGRGYLVAYCANKTRRILWAAVTRTERIASVIRVAGTDNLTFGRRAADGAVMGDWTLKFTGRTRYDVQTSDSELPYVEDVSAELPATVAG